MSHPVLLKFKGCTNSTNITKEVKDYVKNYTECRRKLLLNSLMMDPQSNSIKHTCCDICGCSCRCQCTCGMEECVCAETCENKFQSNIEAHIASMKQVTNPPVDSEDNSELTRTAEDVCIATLWLTGLPLPIMFLMKICSQDLIWQLDFQENLLTALSRTCIIYGVCKNFRITLTFDCWEIIYHNVQSDSERDSTDSDNEIVRTGRRHITMQLSSSSDGSGSCSD